MSTSMDMGSRDSVLVANMLPHVQQTYQELSFQDWIYIQYMWQQPPRSALVALPSCKLAGLQDRAQQIADKNNF